MLLCFSAFQKKEPASSLALQAILAGFYCKCSDTNASVGGVHREVSHFCHLIFCQIAEQAKN